MDGNRTTIEELHEATGVKVRTLRLWTQSGLLQRPGAGRYASYPEGTVETVERVKALYDAGDTLEEIRRKLVPVEPARDAGSYLESLRRDGHFKGGSPSSSAPSKASRPLDARLRHLVRVDVTDTVHLVAEGPLTPEATEALHRAADAARIALSKTPWE